MKISVLMGSPRKNGNTNAVLTPFMKELEAMDHKVDLFWLYDMDIKGCIACRNCQKDWSIFGCKLKDDMQKVFDSVYEADALVLACPIYSWFCTAPMKAVLDRLMYGMNKFYGNEKGPSIWAGKHVSIITTCGYKPEKGADLFEEGIKRYCKHSSLIYDGMLAERDLGYKASFMDVEKEMRSKAFAHDIVNKILTN